MIESRNYNHTGLSAELESGSERWPAQLIIRLDKRAILQSSGSG